MSILYIRDKNGNFVQVPSIPGKSAYEIAVEKGTFKGTEQEFAEGQVIKNKDLIDQLTQENIDKWNSAKGMTDEEAFEAVMMGDCEVEDIQMEDGLTTVYAQSADYQAVRDALVAAKPDLEFIEDLVTYVPQNTVTLTDEKEIAQFKRLQEMLDDIDDVQDFFHNVVDLPEEE